MEFPNDVVRFDFSSGYDPAKLTRFIRDGGWGIGGYNEKRTNMYLAPQYESRRNIHMGLDIWAPAGEPVYAPINGEVLYTAFHDQEGNYGGTIVLRHDVNGSELFALYGHLSRNSLEKSEPGRVFDAGALIGWLGDENENGNWPPHLHYQLSRKDPGEADMPGVVAEENRAEAIKIYPDPEVVFGSFI